MEIGGSTFARALAPSREYARDSQRLGSCSPHPLKSLLQLPAKTYALDHADLHERSIRSPDDVLHYGSIPFQFRHRNMFSADARKCIREAAFHMAGGPPARARTHSRRSLHAVHAHISIAASLIAPAQGDRASQHSPRLTAHSLPSAAKTDAAIGRRGPGKARAEQSHGEKLQVPCAARRGARLPSRGGYGLGVSAPRILLCTV
eukprot:6210249-Pleurochrysis_carterae.AAC.1